MSPALLSLLFALGAAAQAACPSQAPRCVPADGAPSLAALRRTLEACALGEVVRFLAAPENAAYRERVSLGGCLLPLRVADWAGAQSLRHAAEFESLRTPGERARYAASLAASALAGVRERLASDRAGIAPLDVPLLPAASMEPPDPGTPSCDWRSQSLHEGRCVGQDELQSRARRAPRSPRRRASPGDRGASP